MIFLDEKMSPVNEHSDASAWLDEQTKLYGLKESMFKRFAHDAGGMEICFESEVAWNELTHQMAVAEFRSLQESQCLNEGFWDTIVGWARKVKEFFIKIWNAIKAWIKNMWQKLTGTTDKDLIKKVQDVASDGEDVDVEMYYTPNEFKTVAEKAVSDTEQSISKAYDVAVMAGKKALQKAGNNAHPNINQAQQDGKNYQKFEKSSYTSDELSKIKDEIKQAADDAEEKLNDSYEKLADRDTQSLSIGANEIVAGLTDFEKQVKTLIKFLEKKDKYIKSGMKAANDAEKAAKQAESIAKKSAAKPGSGVQTTPGVVNAQISTDINSKIANLCRIWVNKSIQLANITKSRLEHDHDVCRSAAKEFIKTANKNKRERES